MTMELSRKRKRQIKKIKGQTADLLSEQRKVLEHANAVLKDVSARAAESARDDVAPRVKDAIDSGVKPAVATGIHAASSAAGDVKDRLATDVIPAVVSTIGSAMSVMDLAKDPKIQKIVKDAQKKASKGAKVASKKAGKASKVASSAVKTVQKNVPTKRKSGIGFGGVALIIVGAVAVIGAAYAAYQTLRADDDLWVADDDDSANKPAA